MADIIFIYADEDAGRARDVAEALGKAGVVADPDRSVPTGKTYAAYMAERLAAAKAVVMCWSANSIGNPRLTDEAGAARDAGKLAPVTLDGTLPPLGFGHLHTANLKTWPREAAKRQLDALAAALVRMRDGIDTPDMLRRRWEARSKFLTTWKFWLLSILTAAAIGAFLFLSPEGRSGLGADIEGRIASLGAFAALAFITTPLSRALLHLSRRLIGLDSRAFFSTEFLLVFGFAVAAALGLNGYYRMSMPDSPMAQVSLLSILGSGATLMLLAVSIVILPLRALRRLVFGRAKAR